METLSRKEVDCLSEFILNGIAGDRRKSLSPQCVRHCNRHKKAIQTLAYHPQLCWKKRRQLLVNQSGAGWFVPLIGSVLASLLAR